jgi:hypothetical protein
VKFTYTVKPSPDWAPDTLSGLIGQATPDSSDPSGVSFDALTYSQTGADTNDDFNVGSGSSSTGTYTYKRYSPVGAMLVLTFTGSDTGSVADIQMTFTSTKGGNTFVTVFDVLGDVTDLDIGTFTLH